MDENGRCECCGSTNPPLFIIETNITGPWEPSSLRPLPYADAKRWQKMLVQGTLYQARIVEAPPTSAT